MQSIKMMLEKESHPNLCNALRKKRTQKTARITINRFCSSKRESLTSSIRCCVYL